ncbi:phenazine biosynthesis protein [Frankia sp. CcI156]|uniref:Phenazine biosynthesis PhzC/PhzF protein n=1 Tax=Frankia casuarinae (strain DSM 45818 / CECT 9043 / HFP020203 / CcI3) TaxID=106370 RepID=Q2JGB7_FRACC|nr:MULTISPECIES: PhzF family phenazine biosynthesis protein [Frankia]ABD09675.1 Phenazine biosynthesis PhzC/PhzF protein [Frankia casuarinae]ETA03618.1 putative epimerase, PhzC/PhzF [Frankia sp. CcI6]EYT90360.1 putative epimerase, PhzC/PhzF [Frankia casuarinae]KDA43934.1 putative epimerase, PhzC/PhzF [Frankia sp. BMG5.23]KEZ37399.1 putative epimerase, PhzC/PhzF [Frankia sp. CeD]
MIGIEVRTLRVFADETGAGGSLLAVVLDAAKLLPDARERSVVARRLGCPATVFVDDPELAELATFTPTGELPMAGHALVGSAWLLGRLLGGHPEILRPAGGEAVSWQEQGRVWVRGALAAVPCWWHEMLADPGQVDALDLPRPPAEDLTQLWAWEDEPGGVVRARAFASRHGVTEDEACGSASMRLAAMLGRRLTIRHGAGSIVLAQPGPPGHADVGGLVVEDETRFLADLDEFLAR